MGPDSLIFLVPIVAIIGGFCFGIFKTWINFEERKIGLRAQSQSLGSDSLRAEMEALRQEVARLRDTSTQFDISIQHTLEDLQQRMAYVENKVRTPLAVRAEEQAGEMGRLTTS